MNVKSTTSKMTLITMLLAMSVILHYFDPAIPGAPGAKFGLANIIGLITLYLFGSKDMVKLNAMRVLLSSLLRGILLGIGFWMSVFGVVFSTLAVLLFKKTTKMSPVGISVASALFHNIGQVVALIYINKSIGMIYWLPVMLFSAIPTGLLTGYVSLLVLKRFRCSPKLLNLD